MNCFNDGGPKNTQSFSDASVGYAFGCQPANNGPILPSGHLSLRGVYFSPSKVFLASRGERNDRGYEKLAIARDRSPMTPT